MPFGEYELSPSLIGLSLLHTAHPEAFQRLLVRASIPCYRDFTLAMCRSLGFASTPTNLNGLFSLAFTAVAPQSGLTSLVMVTRRFIMQKARRHTLCVLRPLEGAWFQVLFLVGVLFTFPSRYWFAIGLPGVFSLAGWSRRIRAEFLVLRVTQDDTRTRHASDKGLSPAMAGLSRPFSSRFRFHIVVLLPRMCVATHTVWALPRSLATTGGITNLFSLPGGTKMFQFPPFASMHTAWIAALQAAGLSHSEIPGSMVICTYPRLIAAYHVLHRLREPRHPPDALTYFRR